MVVKQKSKSKIGYLTFGRDATAYGLELCLSRLDPARYEVYTATPKTAKYFDVLLFSSFWFEHIYRLHDFLDKAGIKKTDKNRPRIVIGGFNMFNPVPYIDYADAIVTGDGDDIIELAINGGNHSSILTDTSKSVIWNNSPMTPFRLDQKKIARIEIARGCKNKCKFCSISHLKSYRELSMEDIYPLVSSAKAKVLSLFCPSPSQHSDRSNIDMMCYSLNKKRVEIDMRLADISKYTGQSMPRFGMDGLSERIRKANNKPLSNDKIINTIDEFHSRGKRGIGFGMIVDLPGETREDWEEFYDTMNRLNNRIDDNDFVVKIVPCAFSPKPHTPFGHEKINVFKDLNSEWDRVTNKATGPLSWATMIVSACQVYSPSTRILEMISTRGGREVIRVIDHLHKKKVIRLSYKNGVTVIDRTRLVKELESFGGHERWTGKIDKGKAPWNVVKVKTNDA
jgi:radical SAM superfamily enzyme YgiQ (UPF0313 family)